MEGVIEKGTVGYIKEDVKPVFSEITKFINMKTKKILKLIAIVIVVLIIIFFFIKGNQEIIKDDVVSREGTEPVAVLSSPESHQRYHLNKYGRIITEIIGDEISSDIIPIFYGSRDADLNDQSHTDFFERLLMFVKSDVLTQNDIYVENVKLSNIDDIFDVNITTTEGWQIFINSEADFSQQLSNLPMLLQKEIEDKSDLEYIDLRYGAKTFYKFKSF